MTAKTGCGAVHQDCLIDDVIKSLAMKRRQWPEWRRSVLKEPKVAVGPRNLEGAQTIPET